MWKHIEIRSKILTEIVVLQINIIDMLLLICQKQIRDKLKINLKQIFNSYWFSIKLKYSNNYSEKQTK